MKFRFDGSEPVDIPALGLADVQPGDAIDVPPDAADGFQASPEWSAVNNPRTKPKAAKPKADHTGDKPNSKES
jgi:hypothetical protein